MLKGTLVDINKITYSKDGKDMPLIFAVLQVGYHEESVIISEAKAAAIENQIEQEFELTIKKSSRIDQKGCSISFGLGRCVTPTAQVKSAK